MRRFFPVLFLFFALASQSYAWTSKTYQLVVVKACSLMPLSFRNIVYHHKEEILTGVLKPDDAPESTHIYDVNSKSGYLQARIEALVNQIPQKIHDHVSFKEISMDFGRLAHYTCDLNDPLLLSDSDTREPQYAPDFAQYLERNISLFPWIFDGHENALLKNDQWNEYIQKTAEDAVRNYSVIGDSYFPQGVLVSSDTFDPKSLPFGIASLSYSHSITDTVQIWFAVWQKAHADIKFTPFLNEKQSRSHR